MRKILWGVVVSVASLLVAGVSLAQAPVKPGPEHEHLKALEGSWDTVIKFGDNESKGTMTYKMGVGGMWLVSDFEGEFGGQKFVGKGLESYDANKKKYVSVWVDSMAPTPMVSEGAYDKDGKILTMTGEGPGQDGKITKYKSIIEEKDKDTRVFTMSGPDKDGKDQTMFTITYKRKK